MNDYVSANLALRYSRIATKLITAFGIIAMLYIAYLFIQDPEQLDYTLFIFPFIFICFPLISTVLMSRVNYKSNGRAGEPMEYIFGDDALTIKGESFMTKFTWDKIYKVTNTSNWIFIWQGRQFANLIPKKNFTENDISELKTILDLHQVKYKL